VRTCGDGSVYAFNARRLAHRSADANQAFAELHPMDGGARGIVDVQCSAADGSAWVGTWSGMVRFDPGAPRSDPKPRPPLMERVRVYPLDANAIWLPLLSDGRELPAFRRLRFDYASPTLSGSVRYQSRLRGYDNAWVNDANSGAREFGTLPAGSYALEARVVDERGEAGPVLSYGFTIAPAWYQTPPGVAALVLALIGVLSGLVTWRSLALRRRNRELEAQVAERTDALEQRSIELEAANHRLAALADLDGLTGVANRRKLQFELEGAFKDARAMEAHLSLLLIDVDQFKHFNDTYGHLVGDERLRAISERLSGWVGPGELLARYGGEEFVMLMPGSSVDVARERAEAIRRDAHQVGRDGERSTVSIGVAELRLTKAQSTAQLFEYADLALYRAKHAGRDRVEIY
jgi:diguanylate cyclase (GGDEF)-like protein